MSLKDDLRIKLDDDMAQWMRGAFALYEMADLSRTDAINGMAEILLSRLCAILAGKDCNDQQVAALMRAGMQIGRRRFADFCETIRMESTQ